MSIRSLKTHPALDTAVLTACGFSARKDLLAQLLALNLEVAGRIERGESIITASLETTY